MNIRICLFLLIIIAFTYQVKADCNYYLNRAESFYSIPNYDSAIIYFTKSAVAAQTEKNYTILARANNRLAFVCYETERSEIAWSCIKATENLFAKGLVRDSLLLADCIDVKGEICDYENDAFKAGQYWSQSFAIRKKVWGIDNPKLAYSYRNMCRYYNLKVEIDSAYVNGLKAVALLKKDKSYISTHDQALIYLEYAYAAKIYLRRNCTDWNLYRDTILSIYNQALHLAQSADRHNIIQAQIYHGIGNLYTDLTLMYGRFDIHLILSKRYYKLANDNYEKSLNIYSQSLSPKSERISETYWVVALLNEYVGNYDLSLSLIGKSMQAALTEYSSTNIFDIPTSVNGKNKPNILASMKILFDALQAKYRQAHDIRYIETAVKWHEMEAKLWVGIVHELSGKSPTEALNIYTDYPYQVAINDCYELYRRSGDTALKERILFYSELGRNSIIRKNLVQYSVSDTLDSNIRYQYSDIRKNISPHELVIDYNFMAKYQDGDSLLIVALSKDSFYVCPILTDKKTVEADIRVYRSSIITQNFDSVAYYGSKLYSELLMPIINHFNGKFERISIIPDGSISLLPFESIVTGHEPSAKDFRKLHYAIYDYSFKYDLSLTNKYWSYPEMKYTGRILGFAPVTYSNTMTDLPFSRDNLKCIAAMYNGDYFFQSDATKEHFLKADSGYAIIQLASHSVADVDHPDHSGIYFTSGQKLSFAEIYNYKTQCQMLVLTSCETNVGKDINNEGMLSLNRAFLTAGAESVISTLWKTDDKSNADLLTLFYRYLGSKSNVDALRSAKIDYLQNSKSSSDASPYYWSGLIITGQEKQITLKAKTDSSMFLYAIGASLLMAILFYYRNNIIALLK